MEMETVVHVVRTVGQVVVLEVCTDAVAVVGDMVVHTGLVEWVLEENTEVVVLVVCNEGRVVVVGEEEEAGHVMGDEQMEVVHIVVVEEGEGEVVLVVCTAGGLVHTGSVVGNRTAVMILVAHNQMMWLMVQKR